MLPRSRAVRWLLQQPDIDRSSSGVNESIGDIYTLHDPIHDPLNEFDLMGVDIVLVDG